MTALSNNIKHSWLAVRFKYGSPSSPTYTRYTDYPTSIIGPDGSLFTSRTALAVDTIKYSGAFQEPTLKIKVDRGSTGSFTDQVSSGEPHSPISVDIWEMVDPSPGTLPRTILHLYHGNVQIVTRNAEDNSNVIELEAVNLKNQLDVPLGLLLMPYCVWTFTGRGCAYPSSGLSETGDFDSKDADDGLLVTILNLGAQTGRYWHRGYLENSGLRIGIRDWVDSAPTKFYLVQEPPARWIGAKVQVFPGCDKTITTCRARWSNEERFGGFGFAVPAYHPVVEDGG